MGVRSRNRVESGSGLEGGEKEAYVMFSTIKIKKRNIIERGACMPRQSLVGI